MKFGLDWLKQGDELERLIKVLPQLEKLAEIMPTIERLVENIESLEALADHGDQINKLDELLPILEELAAKYKTSRPKPEKQEEPDVKKSTFIRSFKPFSSK